jgi:hypothetical protein
MQTSGPADGVVGHGHSWCRAAFFPVEIDGRVGAGKNLGAKGPSPEIFSFQPLTVSRRAAEHEKKEEKEKIDFHGLIIHGDFTKEAFFGNRNGANFYYNWSPNNKNGYGRYTSSGGYRGFYFTSDFSQEKPYDVESPKWRTNEGQSWEDFSAEQKEWSLDNKKYIEENNLRAVWSGDHDAREAIKNNISLLYENGIFLEKWINVPFLWLVNYSETDDKNGYDYEEINKIKISKFPKEIREKMGFVD